MRLTLVIVALVVVLGGAIYLSQHKEIPVRTALPEKGKVYAFIEEEGITVLPETYLITMPFDGKIQRIPLKEGDRVKKGQVLASMNLSDLQAEVDFYKARKAELEALIKEHEDNRVENTALKEVKTEIKAFATVVKTSKEQETISLLQQQNEDRKYGNAQKLLKSKTISEDDLEERKVAFLAAQSEHQKNKLYTSAWETALIAVKFWPLIIEHYINKKTLKKAVYEKQLHQIEIKLATAEDHLGRAVLKSPLSGVVLKRFVQSERELTRGTALLSLGNLRDLEIRSSFLTEEASKIREGDPVEIYGRSLSRSLRGKVKKIHPQGFTKISSLGVEQQRVYVMVSFPKGEKLPRLGVDYRVYVRVFYDETSEKALVIPRTALFRGMDGVWQIFVVENKRASLKKVQAGLMNNEKVEIKKGIDLSLPVVINPGTDLEEGMRVSEEKGR